jgi:hypothetical protein
MACAVPNPAYRPGHGDASGPMAAIDAATDQRLAPDTLAPDRDSRQTMETGIAGADRVTEDQSAPLEVCPQSPDLTLCVSFEGQVVDESRYRHVLVKSNVSFATGGPAGTAADLDSTSLISLADDPLFDLQALTLEAWINPASLGLRMGILDYQGQYGMFVQADGTVLCVGSGGGSYVRSATLVVGSWVSISCTFDQTASHLWANGIHLATAARTGPLRADSTSGITLGSDGTDGNPFDGLIDNIRLWRVVRTPAEICADSYACP